MLSIEGTPWSPDGKRARDVNIRVDLPGAGGNRGAHPPDIDPLIVPRRVALTREFEKFGLTAQCLGCRAIRSVSGYPANHTERCRERIEQELEKEPEGASRVALDRQRVKRGNGWIAKSLKELARQALVMVLAMNRKLRVDPL